MRASIDGPRPKEEYKMFWTKKEDAKEIKDDGPAVTGADTKDMNDLGNMENMINDVLGGGKAKDDSLRSKASERAESLGLSKFPVCMDGWMDGLERSSFYDFLFLFV